MVHPAAAGPASRNKDDNMIIADKKNNQYETIFKKPEAISLAPICNGINKLLNVPLKPAVKRKNTIMVPCIVTNDKYLSGAITPFSAQLPKRKSIIQKLSPGKPSCNLNNVDITIPINPIKNPVIINCFDIIL